MNKRLFLAVNLPQEIKKEIIETYSLKIKAEGVKKVAEENLHITLRFLGYLEEKKIIKLKEKLQALSEFRGFEAQVTGVGEFGGRILWIGIKQGSQELIELSEKIGLIIGEKDERFHPHVTIARNKKTTKQEFLELVERLKEEEKKWLVRVESVELMEAVLLPQGPAYNEVFSVKLKLF